MNVGMMMVFASYGWENCSDARVWDEEIRLARLAADLGFDCLWSAEHHFNDYSFVPDNLQLMTYLTALCPNLDARLLVEPAVALDEAGLQRIDDHRRRLVEALPRLIHAEAERGELTPGQAASQTKAEPALAQHVENRRLLGDAQRVVPG